MPRLFDDDSASDQIRQVFIELGGNVPMRVLAEAILDRGVLPDDVLARCRLRGLVELCREALSRDTPEGVPFAQPTGRKRDDPWLQMDLFTYEQTATLILQTAHDLRADYDKLLRLRDWCRAKFGMAPEIPQLTELVR